MSAKVCADCGVAKPLEQFQKVWNNARGKHYRLAICRLCRRLRRKGEGSSPEYLAKRRERYAADPAYRRKLLDGQHLSRYGITLDERDALLEAQGGGCSACGTTEPGGHGWTTDHDHACCPGAKSCGSCIRGVLCQGCNLALGHVGDSVERLEALISYLNKMAPI